MIRVQLLGHFAIFNNDAEIILPTAKTRQLAAYLFWQQGNWIKRDFLRGLLWGEVDGEKAAANLRQTIYYLRLSLNKNEVDSIFEIRRDAIRITNDSNICIDAKTFEERALEGLKENVADTKTLISAASIYRNDLLSDMNEDWCLTERLRLSNMYTDVLRKLISRLASLGLYQPAISYAHRWAASNPLDEEAYRVLMRLYAETGQPARSVEQYNQCKEILESELGISPSDETKCLLSDLGLSKGDGKHKTENIHVRRNSKSYDLGLFNTPDISDDPIRKASAFLIYGEDRALQGDIETAMDSLNKALAIYKKHGSMEERARAKLVMGSSLLYTPLNPDHVRALEFIEPALGYYRKINQPTNLCRALTVSADAYWTCGRYAEAAMLAREGLELASTLNNRDAELRLSLILGTVYTIEFRLSEAKVYIDKVSQSLSCFTEAQDMLKVLLWRGVIASLLAEAEPAERFLREAIAITQILTPTPIIKQVEIMARAQLMIIQYIKDDREEMKKVCPLPEAELFDPAKHLSYMMSVLLKTKSELRLALKDASKWLRENIDVLPPTYIVGVIRQVTDQMLYAGLTKKAANWAAVGIRQTRKRGWYQYEAVFHSLRAVAQVKLGYLERAEINNKRAIEKRDEIDVWTLANVARANGLIAHSREDDVLAAHHLKHSINLFKQLGCKFYVRQVKNDLKRITTSPLPHR